MGQLCSCFTTPAIEDVEYGYSNVRYPSRQQPSYSRSNASFSNHSNRSHSNVGSSSSYPQTGYIYQPIGTHNTDLTRNNDDNKIKLYHYTYNDKAEKIRQQKKLKASTESTPEQYRQHGCGVYFTSLGPNVDPTYLAENNFTNGGFTRIPRGIIRKLSSVIEIDFYENEVEKIKKRDRDLYIYRDSIDLNKYKGRYKIYRNKNSKLAIMLADN